MATKTFYRSLMTNSGTIQLMEYDFYDGQIVLDEITVEYDDTINESHREMLIEAIEENIKKKTEKHMAEIFKLDQIKNQLLQIEHKEEFEDCDPDKG